MAAKAPTKRKTNVEKPLCKYGSSCYQKNADHLQKYRHPSPNAPGREEESKKSEVKEPSPPKKTKTNKQSVPMSTDVKQSVPMSTDVRDIIKEMFLVEMPQDFYDFWEFCNSVDKQNPEDVFSDLGLQLVGPFDVLSGKFSKKDGTEPLLCHWRYYYDPPEFQTIIKKDGSDLYHIGYYRDDPKEMPSILASNSAATGAKLNLVGDNIFAAVNIEMKKSIEKAKQSVKKKFEKLQEDMQIFAKSKKHSLDVKTSKTKARDKKVVAKTFHGLGIVVPFDKKNDVGYRPLPESDARLKSLLKKISEAKTENIRSQGLDDLQEIITNVQFANDECDYGMGLELGMDLFCFGESCLHSDILFLLSVAYELLRRPQFAQIMKAHLQNRRTGDNLSDINV